MVWKRRQRRRYNRVARVSTDPFAGRKKWNKMRLRRAAKTAVYTRRMRGRAARGYLNRRMRARNAYVGLIRRKLGDDIYKKIKNYL